MNKKYLCCVHDKKSDTFEGFMLFDNMSQATRAFQSTCEQNEVFKKWPEDFEFILVSVLGFTSGEINDNGDITKPGKILGTKDHGIVIAQARDFVAIANAKNENPTK